MIAGVGGTLAATLASAALVPAAATPRVVVAPPACSAAYQPAHLIGRSNDGTSPTAVSASWRLSAARAKGVTEQTVRVWVAGGPATQGRDVTIKGGSARSFTFDNSGADGETSEASEPVFIEPNTEYDLSVTAVYRPSQRYPEGCEGEAQSLISEGKGVTTRHIFGTNEGLCCSGQIPAALAENAEVLIAHGVTSDRVASNDDPKTEAQAAFGNTPALAYEHHFVNNDVTVGNTPYSERLERVNTASWAHRAREEIETASVYGDVLMEVGNEMWLKGECSECAEPGKYAEMFVALSREVQTAREEKAIPADVKLLFDLTGDYDLAGGGASDATEGRGWLGDALRAQPELRSRIEGFAFHPYDLEGATLKEEEESPDYSYDYGLRGLREDYGEAVALGVRDTNVYATELGVCATEDCEADTPNKPQLEDNAEARTDYKELLNDSEFPEVKGVWWYAAYPVEHKYAFFDGWGGGEDTKLLSLLRGLSKKN